MEYFSGCRLVPSPSLATAVVRGPVTVALLTLTVLMGCSGATDPATPEAAAKERAGKAEDAGQPPPASASEGAPAEQTAAGASQAEEWEWLVDAEGRRYREVRMPKIEGFYSVSEDGEHVFLPPGLRYRLARIEEEAFVVKHYDTAQGEERRRQALEEEAMSSAEAAPAASAIPPGSGAETADRLELTRFDRGLPRRGQWRQGFAVVDLNGDGHLDIVHAPPRKGGSSPLVFLGDSRGSWRLWRELTYEGPELDYGEVAVADFDGDGHLDLAFAVHLRGLLVARGDGQGRFTHWPSEDLEYRVPGQGGPPSYTSRTVLALDWDRDGRPDLLTLSEGPRMNRAQGQVQMDEGSWGVGLYLNRGDGAWERQTGQALRTVPFGDDLTVGDFGADGLPDFATAVHVVGSKGILHMHRSDGSFEQRHFELLPVGLVTAVEAADFDGDGRDDLAVGLTASAAGSDEPLTAVVVFLSREDGAWERRVVAAEGGHFAGISALGAGDLDGDGNTDLVALTGTGDRWVFLGTGGGGFRREESPELAPSEPGCRGYEVFLTDLSGDGRDEAILAFAGEEGTEQIFGGATTERRCPSGGSLEVWKVGRSDPGD